jgi:molybdopterin molybdotransferase
LPVAGVSAAGHPFLADWPPASTIRIMTGAVVPGLADAVVMQERVERVGEEILLAESAVPRPGNNIRLAGEDLRAGTEALPAGRLIRPADLGLAASLGLAELPVRPRLRVAFFSTGDELCSIGTLPAMGQVYDSNRYTLFGMLERLGVDVHDLGVVGDTPEALADAFARALACADVVVTSGGVSVGDADFVRGMLDRLGRTVFWKIAVKPGRPFAYGQLTGGAHFFGLPGNPVAVMVTFQQLVRPALLRLMGVDPLPQPVRLQAVTLAPLRKVPGRFEFQRGRLLRAPDGQWQVDPTGEQGSGMLSSMSLANCFILLTEASATLDAGSVVEVEPFDHGL